LAELGEKDDWPGMVGRASRQASRKPADGNVGALDGTRGC